MSEELVEGQPPADPDDDAELEASEIVTDDKGNKNVSLSTMLKYKKEARELKKRNAELEPVAQRAKDVEERLERATPVIDAILTNPKLRAEALRIAKGTRTTSDTVEQPTDADDPDAAAYAEDAGFYLADNTTPDVARARRVLNRLDARHGRQTDERLRPLAGTVLGSRAEQTLREMIAMQDDDGVPYATEQSIRKVVNDLGPDGARLLANQNVAQVIIRAAIGEDRMANRKPKAADEPLYMESTGGSRRREPAIDPDLKRMAERAGLSEKDLQESTKKLEENFRNRAGR